VRREAISHSVSAVAEPGEFGAGPTASERLFGICAIIERM
jgi:hypothetical protein